ncbi:hypothetical protein KC842_01420 [Candidatus Nomurabacteria bacterium]|nr:hypothetical protein [Candidatus Nomurabacteria bacterium]
MSANNQTVDRIQVIWNMLGGDKVVDDIIKGKLEINVIKAKKIKWLGITKTSATTEKFVARDKFRQDSKEVKFYEISDNFTNWFLAGDGKIEEPLGEQELRYGNLIKNSVDGPIIEELGGEEKAEITLTELYDLIKKQANGGKGKLRINSCANIFYIKDTSGVLRTVYVRWSGDGCYINASSVEYPDDWPTYYQVFSRNS